MYKNCNTEQSVLRQQQLEDCLLQNMLLKPYGDISVSDLCEQSQISRKSFYRYFGSKDGCLCALLDRAMLESSRYEIPADPELNPLEAEFFRILSFWKQEQDLLRVVAVNELTGHLLERMIQHILNEEHDLLNYLGISNVQNYEDPLLFSTTGFLALLLNWAKSGFRKPVIQMAVTMADLYSRPLMTDSSKE